MPPIRMARWTASPKIPLALRSPIGGNLGYFTLLTISTREQQHQHDQALVLQVEVGQRGAVPLGLAERVVHRQRHARRGRGQPVNHPVDGLPADSTLNRASRSATAVT